ncbi:MAG: hypothetical protein PHX04_06010 [Bacilli bacterium]|nr:hypothetical protein [Bacilli bacterium]
MDAVKRKKNYVLEIENLLFKYNIDKKNITIKDLQDISADDFSRIMELMEEENCLKLTEKFQSYNKIIKLYNDLLGDLNEIPDATQYDESVLWLNQIARVITQHIATYSLNQGEETKILENTKSLTLKYINLFQGEELTKEILDPREFDDLLDKCGLDLPTKVAVKKEIGQENYYLNFPRNKQNEDYASKYRLIYDKKSKAYEDEITKILDICLNNNIVLKTSTAVEQIGKIKEIIVDYSYKQVQNAVVAILLKEELILYDKFMNTASGEDFKRQFIENCENLIIISRKHEPKKENIESDAISNKIIQVAEEVLLKAEAIITQEHDYLEKMIYSNSEEYYQKLSLNTGDDEELTLAIIIDSIKQSAKLLDNFITSYKETPKAYEQNCQEQILNITEYIETYEILKKRVSKVKEKPDFQNNSQLIYLTDNNEEALILKYLESKSILKSSRHHLKSILDNLASGNKNGNDKETTLNNHTILRMFYMDIVLMYIPLANNALLILFADKSSNEPQKTVADILKSYNEKISEIKSKSASLEELSLLFDSQTEIRSKIKTYLKSIKKKTK